MYNRCSRASLHSSLHGTFDVHVRESIHGQTFSLDWTCLGNNKATQRLLAIDQLVSRVLYLTQPFTRGPTLRVTAPAAEETSGFVWCSSSSVLSQSPPLPARSRHEQDELVRQQARQVCLDGRALHGKSTIHTTVCNHEGYHGTPNRGLHVAKPNAARTSQVSNRNRQARYRKGNGQRHRAAQPSIA